MNAEPMDLRTGDMEGRITTERSSSVNGTAAGKGQTIAARAARASGRSNRPNRALNLAPGIYAVTAERQGFVPATRESLALEIGRDVAADLILKVGGVTEHVTVEGAATNVDLSSAVAGGVVTTTQIAELPLNG